MIREIVQRCDLTPEAYIDLTTLVFEYLDSNGLVIHQDVIKRYVTGENVPDHILEAFAKWWTVGFARPVPEKIQQFLHSVSAGDLDIKP